MLTLLCLLLKIGLILSFAWLGICTAVFLNLRKGLGIHVIFPTPTYIGKLITFLILPLPYIALYCPETKFSEVILFLWFHIVGILSNPKEGWAYFKTDLDKRWKIRGETCMENGILYTRIGRNWNYGEWRMASPELEEKLKKFSRLPMSDEAQQLIIADHKRPY